jgi:hypothetical protein
MKNPFRILLLSLFLSQAAQAFEMCEPMVGDSFESIEELAQASLEITDKLSQDILSVSVTKYGANQGSGAVSILTDEKGNITAIKVKFNLKGKIQTMMKTFDEVSNDQKIEYIQESETKAALIVKKATGANIDAAKGGEFTFSILAKKPDTYIQYPLSLKREGNSWIVKNPQGSKLSSVDLNPNVSWASWNGTFSKATFN